MAHETSEIGNQSPPGSVETRASRENRPHAPETETASGGSVRVSLALFVLGSVTAALYAFVIYPRQGAIDAVIDLNGFGKLGRHIAAGDGFSLGNGPTIRRAPLYPAFVALLLRVFGYVGPDGLVYRPVIVAQCLMIGLACVTSATLGRKLFGARAGLLAGLLCAVTPQVLRYVSMTEVETSMGLLIALMALTGLNLYREPSLRNGALFGLVTGAASLVKPMALLYPFVLLPWCWWMWWRESGSAQSGRSLWQPLAAALIVFVLCLFPWSLRNRIVSGGRFSNISSNGPGEFLRGYVNAQPKFVFLRQDFGGAGGQTMQWDGEANLYEDALLRQHGMSFFSIGPNGDRRPMEARIDLELRKDQIESAEVKRRLLHEPGGFVKKFVLQLFSFWYVVETRKKSLVVGAIALVALVLAGYGWLRARRNGIVTFPVVSVVLYFNLLYAAILAFARYSMPVFPTLLVLSAYGLTQLRPARQPEER
jgi:4-amino-4-deoxy-L-arabinose transferase-like glycosyltransferase